MTTPSTASPRTIAVRFFELMSAGQLDEALALIGDHGEFWQAGSDGPGRIMTLAALKDMFRTVIGGLPAGIEFTVTDTIAEGNRVVALVGCRARLANGNEYRNSYCFVFDVDRGLIVSGREYMDTMHAARAFASS